LLLSCTSLIFDPISLSFLSVLPGKNIYLQYGHLIHKIGNNFYCIFCLWFAKFIIGHFGFDLLILEISQIQSLKRTNGPNAWFNRHCIWCTKYIPN
jgi:hypothetical protein